MVSGRQWHKILSHLRAKPDMESRKLVKLDSGAHCFFSWDAPSPRFLFSLLLLPMPSVIPKSSRVEFSYFPQSWSFSPFSNANLPDCSSAKTPPGCPGTLAAAWFWGGSKSSGADKFLSLSHCHFLSLTPLLCLRTLGSSSQTPLHPSWAVPQLQLVAQSWFWLQGWGSRGSCRDRRLWSQLCLDINACCFLPLDSSLLWTSWSSWGTWRASRDWHSG